MAVITASSKILAVVEAIGKVKTGQFGEYQSVLLQRYDIEGEPGQLWKSMKPNDAAKFQKGVQCWLIPTYRDGKDTWDIELIDDAPAPAQAEQPKPQHSLTARQKHEIAQYIDSRSDLLAYCFQVANQKLAALDPDSQRTAAIELYRSAVNKFSL